MIRVQRRSAVLLLDRLEVETLVGPLQQIVERLVDQAHPGAQLVRTSIGPEIPETNLTAVHVEYVLEDRPVDAGLLDWLRRHPEVQELEYEEATP